MKTRISQLSVIGFRGATTPLVLDLDVSKPMVVIFGENGSGKSTIVDAIDFVANGSKGALASYPRARRRHLRIFEAARG